MKLAILTDIHGRLDHVPAVAGDLRAADYVLLPGDLTMFGKRDRAIEVLSAIREHNPNVLAVMGNCDYPEVSEYLQEEGLFLHRGHRVLGGVAVVGLGGSLPCPVPTLNEWEEDQIAEHLSAAEEGLDAEMPKLLMTHQPPLDTVVDLAGIGKHVGSEAVRQYIEARQPLASFSGHIHEAQGVDTIGSTQLVNPGPFFEGKYAWCEVDDGRVQIEIRTVA